MYNSKAIHPVNSLSYNFILRVLFLAALLFCFEYGLPNIDSATLSNFPSIGMLTIYPSLANFSAACNPHRTVLCGDYTQLNKFIRCHHGYTPMIKHLITKIYGYKVFAEIDLTNAFHQIRIGDETSRKFSIQTPWGQVQPKFMPEGVAPAFVNCVDRLEG